MDLAQHIAKLLSRSLKSPTLLHHKNGEPLSSKDIGNLGEQMAYQFLKTKGTKPLYRNYRAPTGGEVDIVARSQETLLFIEVKTRTSSNFGRPLDAVTHSKQQLISRGANDWLNKLTSRDIRYRFDVIEIILSENQLPDITWVKNAF